MKYVYIYQHVPKCGGQAFREACRSYFNLVVEKPPAVEDSEAWQAFLNDKVDFAELPEDSMVCGHLIKDGIRPRERYAAEIAGGNVRILTVLRDPFDRAVSAFNYAMQRGKKVAATVEERLARMHNPMSRFLGFSEGDAKEFLKTFFFVGITEQMQASMDLLAHSIGKPPVEVPLVNVTKKKGSDVAPEAVEQFTKDNELDFQLYRAAVELLNDRLRAELGR